jgi:hypothetical protein
MNDDNNCDISPFWRLAEQVSVVQAALLIIGVEPQGIADYVENWDDDKRPANYRAARDAIRSAIEKEVLEGKIGYFEVDPNAFNTPEVAHSIIDYRASTVSVPSLIRWLEERGFESTAFGTQKDELAGFRDPTHLRYSHKLAAVVEAWEQYDSESKEPGTPKQRLMKWLRLNAAKFELTDDDGKPSENVIEELAKVANWATAGGAPKSKFSQPDPD